MKSLAIHWFRRDLRLSDNTALAEACRSHDAVLPVFVFDPHLLAADDVGAPRVAFLLDCLADLRRSLSEYGLPLVIRRGEPARVLVELARESEAATVFANRDYGPYARRRDGAVKAALDAAGVRWSDHADLVLVEPWEALKDDGGPYTVFTPYARRWRGVEKCAPVRRPRLANVTIPSQRRPAAGELPGLDDLGLTLRAEIVRGGESEADRRFERFVSTWLPRYRSNRDLPAVDGTSRLSADLKFGTISPRRLFDAVARHVGPERADLDPSRPDRSMSRDERERLLEAGTFANELCWRDFFHSVLFHFPHVLRGAFQERFANVAWPEARSEIVEAWTEGHTGFPIVDAGMRQLAGTGWMHNRVRMITASFLTKILLVDWRVGEKVFMRRLVDGDPAANNGNWQWSASTGTDATPYFRIFNPFLQSKKFDPDGSYIRRWVPELSEVETRLLHEPFKDPKVLERTGYPPPCVDYASRRKQALALFSSY